MTKKFLSILFLIASAFVLGSCDDSDDFVVGPVKLDKGFFSQTYTIDDDGCCVLKGVKPISSADVRSKVVGYGWASLATYEVQANGKLSRVDYYEDLIGAAPVHYCFESSELLVQYYYIDALPARGFLRKSWSYDATKGFILYGDNKLAIKERYKQVLKLEEANGYTLMYTISKQGLKNDGKGGYEPFYAMTVYERMTDDELKKMKETYTYDLSKGERPSKVDNK